MIERILAICQTKEDQHTWVEMLKQQIRVVRKSSVSSPSPATSPPPGKPQPMPPPHVSLPSASVYSELTAFFADLVQRGIITRKLLKRLLYPQFKDGATNISILGVKVRRNHKVECVIFPTHVSMGTYTAKQTWLRSTMSDTEEEETDSETATENSSSLDDDKTLERRSGQLERQDAVDYGTDEDVGSVSSCASNPFGFIHYYGSKCDGSVRSIEGFVDGRYAGLTEVGSESKKKCDPHQKSTDSTFSSTISISCKQKDGRPPCLLNAQQSSESSFERTSAHRSFPCAVCEDLSQLDEMDSVEPTTSKGLPVCPQTRQSLPVFGPESFSRPEPAPLYVPSCHFTSEKDIYTSCHGVFQDPKPQHSHSMPTLPQELNSPATTHSSSLNMPANVIPVPSAVLAELLYNLDSLSDEKTPGLVHQPDSASSDHSVESMKTVCDIPTGETVTEKTTPTIEQEHCDHPMTSFKPTVSLPRRLVESDKLHHVRHSAGHHRRDGRHRGSGLKPSVPRRCYSYHYISIVENDSPSMKKCTNTEHCRCCGEIPCSSRSSDSGLADIAGNSALPSPDMSGFLHDQDGNLTVSCCLKPEEGSASCLGVSPLALSVTPRESDELDDVNYEAQCICTSPFGSTPRTSAQASLTSEKIFVGSMDSVTPSVTSTSLDPSPLSAAQPWCSSDDAKEGHQNRQGIYRSGMYAHWWLKTKIPASAVMEPKHRTRTHKPHPQTGKVSVLKTDFKALLDSTVLFS